jgi:SAM-dependent methyltransferase
MRWENDFDGSTPIRMLSRACPLCGGEGSKDRMASRYLHLPFDSFQILRCRSCQIRWLDPVPLPDYLSRLYDRNYFEPELEAFSYERQVRETSVCFQETAAAFKQRLTGDATVLDVGCATGDFLLALRQAGVDGLGLELSSYGIEKTVDKGLKVVQGDLFASQLDGLSFGGAHLSHVLEHLPDIRGAMARLRSLLKPDGLVYIEVPYQFDGFTDRFDRWLNRGPRQFGSFSIHHCTFFTPASLSTLLMIHGFEMLSLTTYLPCRRAVRKPTLRKSFLCLGLWLSNRILQRGDVISVWAKRLPD